MRISAAGLALVKRFEGFSFAPYRCPAGWWTIGYGHVITASERAQLTFMEHETAEHHLLADLRIAERAVARFIRVPLTQHQFDALVSFTFNLGAATLQRSTLRRVINRGDHAQAPAQMLRFVWAGGRKLPGLVQRRMAEAALYGAS